MINLDVKFWISDIEIIDWDIKVKISIIKTIANLVFEIDNNNKYIEIFLVEKSIKNFS